MLFFPPPQKGAKGDKGDPGPQGAAGTPKRMFTVMVTTDASNQAVVTFSPPFSKPPVVIGAAYGLGGESVAFALPANVTATGCTVSALKTRGTLVLSTGPFVAAPNTTVQILVSGE